MRRRGLSLVEILLAIAVLAMAATAMFRLFGSSYRAVYRSRFASMAAQVARETLEELQQVSARPAGGVLFEQVLHDAEGKAFPAGRDDMRQAAELLQGWRMAAPVVDSTFSIGATLLGTSPATQELLDDPLLHYPTEYDRLRRSITFSKTADPDVIRARVDVVWQEEGADAPVPTSARFETLLVRTPRGGAP